MIRKPTPLRGMRHAFSIILDRRQRKLLLLVVAGMCFAALLEMVGIGGIPAFVALLTERDRLAAALPRGAFAEFVQTAPLPVLTLIGALLLATIFLVKNIYVATLIYTEARILRDVTVSISTRLFKAYLGSPYTFHLQRNPADLIRNMSTEVVRSVAVIRSSMWIIREALVLFVVFMLLLVVDPLVSLLLFLLLGAAGAIFYASVRGRLARRGVLSQEHRGRQLQAINQGLGSIRDARILGREPFLVDAYRTETLGKEHHELYQRVIIALPRLFLEVVAVTSVVLVAVIFALTGRPTDLLLPVLALLAVAAVRLVPALNAISGSLSEIRYERPALDLISTELEMLEDEQTAEAVAAGVPLRLQRELVVDHVSFCYPGAAGDAVHDVALGINAGEAVAFVGPSGAGKSTLVDVILGLLAPTGGRVLVDGHDIAQCVPAWQRQIGYIPQEIYLIDDSIRRNIAFGLPDDAIDEAAVMRAVRAAHLEQFITTLPDGLETRVGDRGVRLSGGQRQRIGIARALYHDPSVLVMDEATSALDSETESGIMLAINQLRRERTIIMIAHSVATIRSCDRVFRFQDGRLVEEQPAVTVA